MLSRSSAAVNERDNDDDEEEVEVEEDGVVADVVACGKCIGIACEGW